MTNFLLGCVKEQFTEKNDCDLKEDTESTSGERGEGEGSRCALCSLK